MVKDQKPPKKLVNQDDGWHPHVFVSTKPGHPVLREEQCNCSVGKRHQTYESP